MENSKVKKFLLQKCLPKCKTDFLRCFLGHSFKFQTFLILYIVDAIGRVDRKFQIFTKISKFLLRECLSQCKVVLH